MRVTIEQIDRALEHLPRYLKVTDAVAKGDGRIYGYAHGTVP